MSYEKIIQQEKFEFLAYLSEIGGFMSLLLGASVVTLFEFLEYFIVRVLFSTNFFLKRKNIFFSFIFFDRLFAK